MYKSLIFKASLLCVMFHASSGSVGNVFAATNEVGDSNWFVVEPKSSPFYSKKDFRYWHCEGMINRKLIGIIHSDLADLSRQHGLPAPMKSPCHYTISNLNVLGSNIISYTVMYHVDENSAIACIRDGYCENIRWMTFKLVNGELHRSYMLTGNRKTLSACVSMKGKIVSDSKGC